MKIEYTSAFAASYRKAHAPNYITKFSNSSLIPWQCVAFGMVEEICSIHVTNVIKSNRSSQVWIQRADCIILALICHRIMLIRDTLTDVAGGDSDC
jgi:hypothetical protein